MGDVLFWTLRKVMGDAYYTLELHRCWVKIYSRMLKTLVPAGVAHELQGDDTHTVKRDIASMFSEGGSSNGSSSTGPIKSNESTTDRLHSQRIIDDHKEASMSIRPAAAV